MTTTSLVHGIAGTLVFSSVLLLYVAAVEFAIPAIFSRRRTP